MSQDQTYTYYGPFGVLFDNGAGGTKEYTGLRKDFITFNIETKEDAEELADGAELYSEGGRKLTIEITIDEVVAADLDSIESYVQYGAAHEVVITFGEMGATEDKITIASPVCFVHVEGLKVKFRILKGAPVGTTIANILSIA